MTTILSELSASDLLHNIGHAVTSSTGQWRHQQANIFSHTCVTRHKIIIHTHTPTHTHTHTYTHTPTHTHT